MASYTNGVFYYLPMIKNIDLSILGFKTIDQYYTFILECRFKLPERIIIRLVDDLSPEQRKACRTHLNELLYNECIDNILANELDEWFNIIGLN